MISYLNIQSYTSTWSDLYTQEVNDLKKYIEIYIENTYHIGATSIPGLHSTPVIDILIELKDHRPLPSGLLEKKGYIYHADNCIPMQELYIKKGAVSFHLYIVSYRHPKIKQYLLFKDILLKSENIRQRYEILKMRLCMQAQSTSNNHENFATYGRLEKMRFIRSILATRKSISVLPHYCCTADEWKIYQKLKNQHAFTPISSEDFLSTLSIHNLKGALMPQSLHQDYHFVFYYGDEIITALYIQNLLNLYFIPYFFHQNYVHKDSFFITYFLHFLWKWSYYYKRPLLFRKMT